MVGSSRPDLKIRATICICACNSDKERQAKVIRLMITMWLDLWELVSHTGVLGDTEDEGETRERRVAQEEGDN